MRRVARQRDFVNAFPDANALLGALQARALLGEVGAAALGGFGLLMHQARPEVHHRIFAGRDDFPEDVNTFGL